MTHDWSSITQPNAGASVEEELQYMAHPMSETHAHASWHPKMNQTNKLKDSMKNWFGKIRARGDPGNWVQANAIRAMWIRDTGIRDIGFGDWGFGI